jgi:hypothetical protein
MRRCFLLVAVVLMVSCWSGSARAQYGFGQGADPNAEIESARKQALQQRQKYAKPSGAGAPRRSAVGGGFLDTYGRADLSGRGVSGYPVVRGDLSHTRVSRGGANGAVKRGRRR